MGEVRYIIDPARAIDMAGKCVDEFLCVRAHAQASWSDSLLCSTFFFKLHIHQVVLGEPFPPYFSALINHFSSGRRGKVQFCAWAISE